jgi:hypothetical protein
VISEIEEPRALKWVLNAALECPASSAALGLEEAATFKEELKGEWFTPLRFERAILTQQETQ